MVLPIRTRAARSLLPNTYNEDIQVSAAEASAITGLARRTVLVGDNALLPTALASCPGSRTTRLAFDIPGQLRSSDTSTHVACKVLCNMIGFTRSAP